MAMKKSLANQIAKVWNAYYANSTDDTKTKAVIKDYGKWGFEVNLVPYASNTGTAFYHCEELVLVASTFKCSFLVSKDEHGKLIGRIF